jgi:ATP-dependent Clp protease ATP-binding subunit ClpA
MFERFTDRARRVVVQAQDEARGLQHNFIGTEHLLLGLLAGDGVAARVLERYDMPVETVRNEVRERVGIGKASAPKRIPFTPRGKKVLELALREALQLSHNYIGTEHILLGLIREGDGVGAQIIKAHAGDLRTVRMAVLDMVPPARLPEPARRSRWMRRAPIHPAAGSGAVESMRLLPEEAEEAEEPRTTPAAENTLDEASRLAAGQAVGSQHLLLAALADADSVAARTLAGLGVDLEQAKQALRQADVTGTSDEQPEDAGRRQMRIKVGDDQLTIEAADPAIVALGRAAIDALGEQVSEPGVIAGDQAASASLSELWLALKESLEDIRRRAQAIADVSPEPTGTEPADTEPTGTEPTGTEPTKPDTGTGAA